MISRGFAAKLLRKPLLKIYAPQEASSYVIMAFQVAAPLRINELISGCCDNSTLAALFHVIFFNNYAN